MMDCYNDNCKFYNQDFMFNCRQNAEMRTCEKFVPESAYRSTQKPIESNNRDPKSRYYDAGGIEVQDIIKAKLTPEQYQGFLLGNIIKYSCRFNFKGQNVRDADKIAFYSMWLNGEMTEDGS